MARVASYDIEGVIVIAVDGAYHLLLLRKAVACGCALLLITHLWSLWFSGCGLCRVPTSLSRRQWQKSAQLRRHRQLSPHTSMCVGPQASKTSKDHKAPCPRICIFSTTNIFCRCYSADEGPLQTRPEMLEER